MCLENQVAAKLFASEGAKVIVADFQETVGRETAAMITELGGNALFLQVDGSDRESVQNLINNAGVTADASTSSIVGLYGNFGQTNYAAAKGGEPIDVANAYLFLVSDAGRYVNGAVLSVDGGMTL